VKAARAARSHGTPFPRFTWFECGCGCGYEGECEIVQWQLEDAMLFALDLYEGEQARLRFDDDAVADAERRVAEALAQGRR